MKSYIAVLLVIVVLSASLTEAVPLRRAKRVSDQRLAELETLIALAKMKGRYVTMPVGFGMINPSRIGKRKRSVNLLIPMEESQLDISKDSDTPTEEEQVSVYLDDSRNTREEDESAGNKLDQLSTTDYTNLLALAKLLRTKQFYHK